MNPLGRDGMTEKHSQRFASQEEVPDLLTAVLEDVEGVDELDPKRVAHSLLRTDCSAFRTTSEASRKQTCTGSATNREGTNQEAKNAARSSLEAPHCANPAELVDSGFGRGRVALKNPLTLAVLPELT